MNDEEKAAAYDVLVAALVHRWTGYGHPRWSWWCCTPCGGAPFATPEEAEQDLLAWADRVARRKPPDAVHPQFRRKPG